MGKLLSNVASVLQPTQIAALRAEIDRNAVQLFRLGEEHFNFAARQASTAWRQKVSRCYYGAFNVSRAVRLQVSGEYSGDVADHKRFENLPDDFPSKNTYVNQLNNLRIDRNLCDYDHTAVVADLLIPLADVDVLVTDFIRESRQYLNNRGVAL